MKLQVGDTFDGRYLIERELGEGGFAKVYLARRDDEAVALKVLRRPPAGYAAETIARAKRETQILQRLDSPLLVKVYESAISSDGLLYLVFEYVPGIDLSELLAMRGRLEPDEVAGILRQILTGLNEAHEQGLIHRDIKPQNIRVTDPERLTIKLLDFGIARPEDDSDGSITRTGEFVGTLRYMAPEQLTRYEASAASDIYGAGVVGFEMLLGSDRLHGPALGDQLDRLRSGHVFALPAEGVHPVWAAVERMTARDPGARFATCKQALRALDRGGAGGRRRGRRSVTHRRTRRGPGTVVAALLLAVGVLVLLRVSVVIDEEPEARRPRVVRAENPLGPVTVPVRPVAEVDVGVSLDLALEVGSSYAPDPSAGCGKPLRSEGKPKHVVLRLPSDYDPDRPYPLLMFLHDDLVDPKDVLDLPSVQALLAERGAIAVAPQDLRKERKYLTSDRRRQAWRTPKQSTQLIRETHRWAVDALCIDQGQAYVVGHGAGGHAAQGAACERWVTAVGAFGTPMSPKRDLLPDPCARPSPLIWMHPMNSPVVPAEGGVACRAGVVLAVAQTEERLRTRYRCEDASSTWRAPPGAECAVSECKRASLGFCRVTGGAVWPGLERNLLQLSTHGSDCVTDRAPDYPMLSEMWRFFEEVR